jgi:hypothetical protein
MALICMATPGAAQQAPTQPVSVIYRYADVADLALASSVVAHVKLKGAERLSGKLAQGVAPGHNRYFVKGDVIALIRAPGSLAKRLSWLIDLPADSRARVGNPLKGEQMVFALTGRPGELKLVAPDAHIPFSPELGTLVRSILTEAARPDAAPKVTGISSAFHAPGNLTGEGETQIFLDSANGRPVSLNIRRRVGEQPRWFASAGETVDEGATPPKRNTLLWYRLACTLPGSLPQTAVADLEPANAAIVAEDYKMVLQGLGNCQRARPPVG